MLQLLDILLFIGDCAFFLSKVNPDTENIKELQYLDFFCKEVLRVYPIARR